MKVPRTRSKNPVTILRNVIKAIEGEPKRYKQSFWCIRRASGTSFQPERGWPDCGTIGCVALWTCVVTGHEASEKGAMFEAPKILGLDHSSALRLFSSTALWNVEQHPGTRAYAKAGVNHIKRFVKDQWGVTL